MPFFFLNCNHPYCLGDSNRSFLLDMDNPILFVNRRILRVYYEYRAVNREYIAKRIPLIALK